MRYTLLSVKKNSISQALTNKYLSVLIFTVAFSLVLSAPLAIMGSEYFEADFWAVAVKACIVLCVIAIVREVILIFLYHDLYDDWKLQIRMTILFHVLVLIYRYYPFREETRKTS